MRQASFVRIEPFGVERAQAALSQSPQILGEELFAAMVESDEFLARETTERAPQTANNTLRNSITTDERVNADGVIGIVFTPLMHGVYVELGTKPHFPPVEPLIDWVKQNRPEVPEKQVKSVAFLIARAISVRGTLAVGMFHRAFAYARPQIEARFAKAIDRALERARGAGGAA